MAVAEKYLTRNKVYEFAFHPVSCPHDKCGHVLGEPKRSGFDRSEGRHKAYCPVHGQVYYNLKK